MGPFYGEDFPFDGLEGEDGVLLGGVDLGEFGFDGFAFEAGPSFESWRFKYDDVVCHIVFFFLGGFLFGYLAEGVVFDVFASCFSGRFVEVGVFVGGEFSVGVNAVDFG